MAKVTSLPIKVKIGPFTWTIEKTPSIDHDKWGLTNYQLLNIQLSTVTNREQEYDTVLHELTHAIIYSYAIKVDEDDEEYLVTALARGFGQTLRDNKKLREYLLNG